MSKQTKFVEDEEIKIHEVIPLKDIPLKEAEAIVSELITLNDTWCDKIEAVGSIRRQRPAINDIDFVVLTTDKKWEKLRENVEVGLNATKLLSGAKILRFVVPFKIGGIQVDFYRATEDTYGILKLVRTGSADHNIWLARFAIQQDLRLTYSKGICDGETIIAGSDEIEVFKALNLEFIPPTLREINSVGKPIWEWSKYYMGG